MKLRYIGIGAPAAPIKAPDTVQAKSLSLSVGTPEHSAASSASRGAGRAARLCGLAPPAAPIRPPDTWQAKGLSLSVGTPEHSAASSESRIARSPRPIQDTCT